MSQQQSLTAEESERVKDALIALRHEHESQVELAKSLVMPDGHTVSQQVLSSIMNDHQPAGVSVARAVAKRMGITFDELVTGTRLVEGAAALERNENVPGWKEAAAEVVAKRYAPRHAVEAVAKMFVTVRPARMTPDLVYDLTLVWMRHAPLAVRLAAEKAELAEDVARKGGGDDRGRVVIRSGERVREDKDAVPGQGARARSGR